MQHAKQTSGASSTASWWSRISGKTMAGSRPQFGHFKRLDRAGVGARDSLDEPFGSRDRMFTTAPCVRGETLGEPLAQRKGQIASKISLRSPDWFPYRIRRFISDRSGSLAERGCLTRPSYTPAGFLAERGCLAKPAFAWPSVAYRRLALARQVWSTPCLSVYVPIDCRLWRPFPTPFGGRP
jgi:hypothetical protein